jgi:hypothetical protein
MNTTEIHALYDLLEKLENEISEDERCFQYHRWSFNQIKILVNQKFYDAALKEQEGEN